MLLIKLCSLCKKIAQSKIKNTIFKNYLNQNDLVKKANFSKIVDTNFQIKSDVVLYAAKRPKLFVYIPLFCSIQIFYWSAFFYSYYTGFESFKKSLDESPFKWFFSEKSFLTFCGLFYFGIGVLVSVTSYVYSVRLVENVILKEGGLKVKITTHKILGFNKEVEVPLREVSSNCDYFNMGKYIYVRVKNKPINFILDTSRGEFKNPKLFFQTVAKKRNF